ncbi:hypothetical protein LENED_005393 [Lentinula edodes]|uniref:Uncharacterized protein n=1 Tax=Lentinula edodes TaxID=5353 RepID=A0A1Q3E8T8_LENED|nr:hypothetical protein LENED_005393 [Lentinula edodes]
MALLIPSSTEQQSKIHASIKSNPDSKATCPEYLLCSASTIIRHSFNTKRAKLEILLSESKALLHQINIGIAYNAKQV